MKQIPYATKYSVDPNGQVYGPRGKLKSRDVGYEANGSCYRQVALYADGRRINKYVHVLVAEAYISGYTPDLQVNHIDGDKANNQVRNLEQVSGKENMQHACREGLLGGKLIGKNNPSPRYQPRLTRAQKERATTIP